MGWESSYVVIFGLSPSFKVTRWFTSFSELSFTVDTNLHWLSDALGIV